MPLVRFEVKNEYGLGDPELYRGAAKREDPKALLDGMAVAGLVGILRQLGDLAEFAADVFHELHEQVTTTAARGRKILTQIQHIEEALPSIEKAVQGQTSHIHFAYVAGSDWHANIRTEEGHLLSSDLPRFIMDSYEECHDPPRLYLLDKFDTAGAGACLKRYSDPSYFKRALASSELARAEKIPREKKVQKYKRKGSRLRNREAQHSISITQRSSSSARFASPSTDGQSISSENTFVSDMRLKPEVASTSTSFDSKTRLNNIDRVSDTNPSLAPDELESDNSSVSKLQINHSDVCAPTPHDGPIGEDADDYSQHDILQGPGASGSPSVTWDEKTEIEKALSPKSCNDIPVDMVQDSESSEVRCEPLHTDHEIDDARAEQEDILFDIENVPVSVSGGNHFDEVTSETDNYMDALNTMESEVETDSECQTKREVGSLSTCRNQGLESGTGKIQEITDSNVDSSDVEAPIASNISLNKDASSKFSNLEQSENLAFVHTPHRNNGFAPIPDQSLGTDLSETTIHDIPRTNSIEDTNGGLNPETSALGDKTPAPASTHQELPVRIPSISSAMFWTNGGLLGVEPSKPPDFNTPDTVSETILSCGPSAMSDTVTISNESISRNSYSVEKMNTSPGTSNSVDQSSLRSDQLTTGTYSPLPPIEPSKCISFCHDDQHDSISIKQNFQKPIQALQLTEPEKSQSAAFNGVHAHTHQPDLTEAKAVAFGAELSGVYNADMHSNQPGQASSSISSSFSGLAQRLLANSLQRKASLTSADISMPSEINTATRKSPETSLPNKHQEVHSEVASQASCEPMMREKTESGKFKKSVSYNSHYSERSSPPLEHMKISFHPMNGSETSKLKLDFSNGNLHESIEDLMFPSFQLLPGPTVSLPDSCPESDDDTFCQSCPYSSEELLSPRSDSNSELWEQDGRSTSKNHGIYDDSQRISSSSATVSSFVGFEERNNHSIDPAIGLGDLRIENDVLCPQPSLIADLPGLDSIEYSINKQEREGDSLSINPRDSRLQSPNDLPPPPPLPPVQWRIMKSAFILGEEKNSVDSEKIDHIDGAQDQRFTCNKPQGHNVLEPPSITEATTLPNKRTHGEEKLNGHKEPGHGVNNEPDERDELLRQIRNKTFNLRRMVTAKPSFMPEPTTNVNVAAILEKANAIRQAFVGSDEGGEDDNWSDS